MILTIMFSISSFINQEEYNFIIFTLSGDRPSKDFTYSLHTQYISKSNMYTLKFNADAVFLHKIKQSLLLYTKNIKSNRKVTKLLRCKKRKS